MFDTIAIVDWSASNQPKTGKDSIWISWHDPNEEKLENPPTRHCAKELLAGWLTAAVTRGERVLIGFDFPFGYPAGFAARLGLSGQPWHAIWDEISRLLKDDERNRSNRFDVAAALNQRVSGELFPFWGCPPSKTGPFLGRKHHYGHETNGLSERRLIDEYMPGAQPCWKLLGAGCVGSQALTGIPVVRALRNDHRCCEIARIWPFETGLYLPDDAGVVFSEVYPSFWKKEIPQIAGKPNDAAQVRFVAQFFAKRDSAGELAALFAGDPGLTWEDRRRVETEEAWALGVTKPR